MFFLVNKPKNVTSFDVVNKFKQIFIWEKVGHSGTLDPMATWLLIIAVWKNSTKHLWKFLWMDKEYITEIDFSLLTDTWDIDYCNTYKKLENLKKPSLKNIKEKLNLLIPEYELPLTMFSAKKRNWKKLYELARKGVDLKLKQTMKVNSYEILDYNFPILKLKLNVGSWTYIRSIWYWLWQQFWLWWTLTKLHRTKIWNIQMKKNQFNF